MANLTIDLTAEDIHRRAQGKGFYDASPERDEIDTALGRLLGGGVSRWAGVAEGIRENGRIPEYVAGLHRKSQIQPGSVDAQIASRLMLIVTECVEALEAVEAHARGEKHNLGEELADVSIRTLDLSEFCCQQELCDSPAEEIDRKMATNEKRPHMHGKRA